MDSLNPLPNARCVATLPVAASVGKLLAISIVVFGPATTIAWWAGGPLEAGRCSVAAAVATPLAAISLGFAGRVLPRGFNWQFAVIVGGSGVRTMLVLALAGLCFWTIPFCRNARFWLWTACAYLLTLSIEVTLLIQLLDRWSSTNLPTGAAAGVKQIDTGL